MTNDDDDPLVAVSRQGADPHIAKYRFSQLEDLHWECTDEGVSTNASRSCLHCYVRCDAIVSGELPHSDLEGPCPHRVNVCISERNSTATLDRLRRLAAQLSLPPPALEHFRYPIDGPNEIEKAIDDAIREVFGPEPRDSPYSKWLDKLRRNGLIP